MIILVMGVSGAGKSTVAAALAQRLRGTFLDCDALHPPANVAKMHAGHALTEADREPWLAAVAEQLRQLSPARSDAVVACSALKVAYRQRLKQACGHWLLIYLKGAPDELARRLRGRTGHFMPAALLDSQLATLQEPLPEEHALVLNAQYMLETNLDLAVAAVRAAPRP